MVAAGVGKGCPLSGPAASSEGASEFAFELKNDPIGVAAGPLLDPLGRRNKPRHKEQNTRNN